MAKWYGLIGFIGTEETEPGVWEPTEIERPYFGDVLSNVRRWESKDTSTNDDLSVSNRLSIVADDFALNHIFMMKWAEFGGARWRISSVTVEWPRLTLELGGSYNA